MFSFLSSWAKRFAGDDDDAPLPPPPGPARIDTSRSANRQRQPLPPPRNLAEIEQQISLLDSIARANNSL